MLVTVVSREHSYVPLNTERKNEKNYFRLPLLLTKRPLKSV